MHLILKYIRQNMLEMTLREVAEKLDLTHPAYRSHEVIRDDVNGKKATKITLNFLQKYCELFNFNIYVMLDICKISMHIKDTDEDLSNALSPKLLTELRILFYKLKG